MIKLMTTLIFTKSIAILIMTMIKVIHTGWLLKKSNSLRNKLDKLQTSEEKYKACKELLEFTNKHLKSSTINSIFALVLDFFHNRHPK